MSFLSVFKKKRGEKDTKKKLRVFKIVQHSSVKNINKLPNGENCDSAVKNAWGWEPLSTSTAGAKTSKRVHRIFIFEVEDLSEDTTKYHLNLLLNISVVQIVVCTPTTDLNQTLQLLALYNYNNDQD